MEQFNAELMDCYCKVTEREKLTIKSLLHHSLIETHLVLEHLSSEQKIKKLQRQIDTMVINTVLIR